MAWRDRWQRFRWALGVLGSGRVSGRDVEDRFAWWFPGLRPQRWLLLQRRGYCDVLETWTAAGWWCTLLGRIKGGAWRMVVALGVWEVEDGGYYQDGGFCAVPWRNPASAWCLGWRRALWPWKG